MKEWAIHALLIAALFLAGVAGGVAWESGRQNADLIAAKTESATCEDAAASQTQVLAQLQQNNATHLRELQTAQAQARQAIGERDAARQQLSDQAHARQIATIKVSHENAECQSLASLPVCPAVADRLWGKARTDVADRDTAAGY